MESGLLSNRWITSLLYSDIEFMERFVDSHPAGPSFESVRMPSLSKCLKHLLSDMLSWQVQSASLKFQTGCVGGSVCRVPRSKQAGSGDGPLCRGE